MSSAERQKRRGTAPSDVLLFVAIAGLGFTLTMGSDLTGLGRGTEWRSFQELWERGSSIASRVPQTAWSYVPKLWARPSGPTGTAPARVEHSTSYAVRPGDTLSRIAETHGVALGALASINRITDPDMLEVGQTLRIPGSDRSVPSGAQTQDPPVHSKGVVEIAGTMLDRLLEGVGIEGWADGFVGSSELPQVSAANPTGTTVVAAALPTHFRTVDGLLAIVEDELLNAHFQNALQTSQTARRLLEQRQDPVHADPRRVRLEIFSATAHTAFGDSQAARLSFERALESDPDLVLDPALHSPKVLRAFEAACLNVAPDREQACQSELRAPAQPPSTRAPDRAT
jgi:LysM repeat protein